MLENKELGGPKDPPFPLAELRKCSVFCYTWFENMAKKLDQY